MAYSTDYRLCIVNNIKQGMTWDEAMTIFHISRQTLSNWLKLWEQRADVSVLPRKAYPARKIELEELINLVEKEPDWTLAEYAAHFGCSAQAVANRLKQQKITRKKIFHYEERDEVKRQAYLSRHNELDASKIVYVDESGIEEAEKKGKRSRRVNIIAGLVNNRLIAPCVFNGYVNADCFKDRSLLLIMPVSISQLRLEKAQCRLVFLPAYSPDLNPIENCWAIIKALLKKIGKQFDNFNHALDHVLSVCF